jgi:hypothetical protein
MLVKLISKDLNKYWPVIAESLKKTLTKEKLDTPEKLNSILKALLLGSLTCWLYINNEKIKGVIITSIMIDQFLQEKNLLIYSVYTKSSSAEEWADSFDGFSKYGKSIGCSKIIFYTSDKRLIAITRHFGFISSSVCEIEI